MPKQLAMSLVAVIVASGLISAAPPIPKQGESSKVALQCWMGTYVCAEGGGGASVVVNRRDVGEWEQFEMKRIDESHVSLRASNGKYLCALEGGGTVVLADRSEVRQWERFELLLQQNGLVTFKTEKGKYLCAEPHGLLMAKPDKAAEWESFRVVLADQAASETTRVEVNVYKLESLTPVVTSGLAPLWHTGVVVDSEHYFHTEGKVRTCVAKNFNTSHHCTIVRFVPGNAERVRKIRDDVVARWNGTRYDLGGHNCNFFTDDVLQSLGAPGLDQEYLNASGLAKGLRQVPGGSLAQELLVKWPVNDKRLDKAFMDDLVKLNRVPQDVVNEVRRFGGTVSQAAKDAGGPVSDLFKRINPLDK